MAYEEFAQVYDEMNEDADYDALFSHISSVLHAHGITDGIVADLGCGTGELTLMLAQAGYDMIGVDLSEDMLSVLREKADELELDGLLLLQQDLKTLDLYGTVRAAVSTFDTFNHIGPYADFEAALCRAALFIEPEGVFLFDLNTPYKHENVLANHTFVIEAEDAKCVWENRYDACQTSTQIGITITYAQTGQTFHETFTEYCYTLPQIEHACKKASLEIEMICDGERFTAVHPDTQRYLISAIKR